MSRLWEEHLRVISRLGVAILKYVLLLIRRQSRIRPAWFVVNQTAAPFLFGASNFPFRILIPMEVARMVNNSSKAISIFALTTTYQFRITFRYPLRAEVINYTIRVVSPYSTLSFYQRMSINIKVEEQDHSSDIIVKDFAEITKDHVPGSNRDDLPPDSKPFNELRDVKEESKHTSPFQSSSRSPDSEPFDQLRDVKEESKHTSPLQSSSRPPDPEPFHQLCVVKEESKHTSPLQSLSRSQSTLSSLPHRTRTETSVPSTEPASSPSSSEQVRGVHQA